MNNKVCVILLNWNSQDDTKECINSLLKSKFKEFDILVIDNGSLNKLNDSLFEKTEVILLEENLGFAGGYNYGIKHAINKGYQYLWILNNDTTVDDNALGELVKASELTDYSIFGSLIMYYDNKEIIWYSGGYFSKIQGKGVHLGKNKKIGLKYLQSKEVEFVTGCSIFIKSEVFNEVGFFDEKLFAYGEDLDFSLRLKKYGYKILYCPNSVIFHKVGRSFQNNDKNRKGKTSPLQIYLFNRNRILIAKKHLNIFYRSLFLIRFIFFNIIKSIILVIIGRKEKSKKLFKALIDGNKNDN